MAKAKMSMCVVAICLLSASLASAEATSERTDFGPDLKFNSCTGEVIEARWTVHMVIHPKKDGTYEMRMNLKGSGVSNLGVKYQWSANNKFTAADPLNLSDGYRSRVIGQGPSNNEFLITSYTIVDGIPESKIELECR